jgi:hypothetical protein
LRPPFAGNNFNELRLAVNTGKYAPIPSIYSDTLRRTVTSLLKTNPLERPTASVLIRSPEMMGKLQLEGGSKLNKENDMMKTIVVPYNLRRLSTVLPKACYPDLRPLSPSSWPVIAQKETMVSLSSIVTEMPISSPSKPLPELVVTPPCWFTERNYSFAFSCQQNPSPSCSCQCWRRSSQTKSD